ncbi:BRCT domain protein [Aspergillus clavatus NRRL 1]|uniref:BRCT domain protein n=1 Tax=Aspergillus clavatus (strain ATCC 1007 / CBS 513.65 / DSM 816 / NCTC 3887 / NRRL 1 / QM 1276 / 107) TaxID=344612 RepID=A1CIF3_ASPCL|nr:BRCT domain protein [Aspergillus clavatus NRRL 1]EAW10658.1 BRCT domain protein [Aspergillus clavatus NRRL 1]
MAGRDADFQLFDQCKVCIVCSKDLDPDSAHQLASTFEAHGGETVIYEPPASFPPLEEFTHLISYTVDFPSFDAANDALIPVVKPQWVQASLAKKKLANPRQYNPDPRLFLNDVVVTCGDIPEGDKDAIIGGVLAKGGLYSPRVTGLVTHLVDLTMDSDKARLITARKLNIKIVLPHWFDDCLKLGKRIDERPYTLPHPEILRAGPDAPVRSSESRDVVGASTPEPTKLPTSILTSQPRPKLDVFQGKTIMLAQDLGIGTHLSNSIIEVIKDAGGSMTTEISQADIYVCRYREGVGYRLASKYNKEVGNLAWLYHMITYNAWTSPLRRMLHYPTSRSGIPGFKGLKISLSNYVGEARSYLENLIAATGAECTKTLKQENTHLVTAHGNSEKCAAAKEWGLHVVNHLWLEESYARWKMLPVSDPRYTHFPKRTNLGEVVGQTRLDKAILESLFFPSDTAAQSAESPRRVMQKRDENTATDKPSTTMRSSPVKVTQAEHEVSDTRDATPRAANKSRKSSDYKKPQTPARARLESEGKENQTPSSTSSRKSKEAAFSRLQELAPDIALYEKEKKRVGGVVYGGRRKSDEDRVALTNTKKRRSMEPQEESDEEIATDAKRQKKSKPPIAMHLLITGYQRWVGNLRKEDADKSANDDKRQLRDLGIMVVQDARRCTHLAAPSILRTPKFVNALAYGPVIINVDFIEECLTKDELLNPDDFPLMDTAAEKKFGFSLEEARANARKNKNRLLQGYQIYCVETIRGGFDAFKSIVDINGGICTLFRGRVSYHSQREESEDDSSSESDSNRKEIYLLSSVSPDHQKLWPRFQQLAHSMSKTPRIVRVDWLLDIAMSQELRRADEYELKEGMMDQADN